MKIAAIVILYHPDEEAVRNILTYSHWCQRLYLFDNTPHPAAGIRQQLSQIPNAVLLYDQQNKGIPERLNAGCRQALAEGFGWVLTMDQDTRFAPDVLANYLSCFEKYAGKEQVAAFCTRYSRNRMAPDQACGVLDTDDVITSGMLVNIRLWKQLGGFDEALFIDGVDQEYHARAVVAGCQIVCFSGIWIVHQIGTLVYRSSVKSLFTVRKYKVIHSPLRCYYIYRNMLYLENKYRSSHPAFARMIRKNVYTHLKGCVLYGRDAIAYFRYLRLAKRDYCKGRMGKIADEKVK